MAKPKKQSNVRRVPSSPHQKQSAEPKLTTEQFLLKLDERHRHHFIADCGDRLLQAFAGQFPHIKPLEDIVRLRREWADGSLSEEDWKSALQRAQDAAQQVIPEEVRNNPTPERTKQLSPLQQAQVFASMVFLAKPEEAEKAAEASAQAIGALTQDREAYEREKRRQFTRAVNYTFEPRRNPNAKLTQEDIDRGLRRIDGTIKTYCSLFLSEAKRHFFIADCLERVLPIYEAQYPDDKRPREAVEARRLLALGQLSPAEWDKALNAAQKATIEASFYEKKTKPPTDTQRAATLVAAAVVMENKKAHEAAEFAAYAVRAHTGSYAKFLEERGWQVERVHYYSPLKNLRQKDAVGSDAT